MHHQADDALGLRTDRPQILRRRMRAVVQTRGVLHGQNDLLLGDTLLGCPVMRFKQHVHLGVLVFEKSIRRFCFRPTLTRFRDLRLWVGIKIPRDHSQPPTQPLV